jgi:hypothetical protein
MQLAEAHVIADVLTALQRSGTKQYANLKRLGDALGWPVPPRDLTAPISVPPELLSTTRHQAGRDCGV